MSKIVSCCICGAKLLIIGSKDENKEGYYCLDCKKEQKIEQSK